MHEPETDRTSFGNVVALGQIWRLDRREMCVIWSAQIHLSINIFDNAVIRVTVS